MTLSDHRPDQHRRERPRRSRAIFDAPTRSSILHVISNLRSGDRRELEARRHDATAESYARELFVLWPRSIVFHVARSRLDAEPIALLVVMPTGAASAEAAMVATDRFSEIGLSMTRHILRKLIPAMIDAGLRRVECRALGEHTEARQWLIALGAVEECPIPDGGKDGELFFQYAWRLSDVRGRFFNTFSNTGADPVAG